MQTNTEFFLFFFFLKSFAFENILQCKMFYIETNEALVYTFRFLYRWV